MALACLPLAYWFFPLLAALDPQLAVDTAARRQPDSCLVAGVVTGLDPWGRPWVTRSWCMPMGSRHLPEWTQVQKHPLYTGGTVTHMSLHFSLQHSAGPNGIDEQWSGDDLLPDPRVDNVALGALARAPTLLLGLSGTLAWLLVWWRLTPGTGLGSRTKEAAIVIAGASLPAALLAIAAASAAGELVYYLDPDEMPIGLNVSEPGAAITSVALAVALVWVLRANRLHTAAVAEELATLVESISR